MKKVVIASATVVGKSQPLDANELAHACGAEVEWVARLVEVGIVSAAGDRREEWRFHSLDLRRAREARRLERDFDAGLDAVALILDLSQEVRRLKAQLRALGATRVGAGQEPDLLASQVVHRGDAWGVWRLQSDDQGFSNGVPSGVKSATLRVTTIMPCTSAVAGISASRSDRRSGTCRAAQRRAILTSVGNTWAAKVRITRPFIQARSTMPCRGSLRSAR